MARGFDPSRSPGHGVLLAKGFSWNGELEAPKYRRNRIGGAAIVSRDTRGGWLLIVKGEPEQPLAVASVHFDTLGRLARAVGT